MSFLLLITLVVALTVTPALFLIPDGSKEVTEKSNRA